jgi:hypothetical protein
MEPSRPVQACNGKKRKVAKLKVFKLAENSKVEIRVTEF